MDTLLHCSTGVSENGAKPKPCPPRPGEKGEMHVVSYTFIFAVTRPSSSYSIRVSSGILKNCAFACFRFLFSYH